MASIRHLYHTLVLQRQDGGEGVCSITLYLRLLYAPPVLTFRSSTFSQQCIYMLYTYLTTNSEFYPIHYSMTGVYNWEGKCLVRGRNCVFNKTNYVSSWSSSYLLYSINQIIDTDHEDVLMVIQQNLKGLISLNRTPVTRLLLVDRRSDFEVMRWKGDIVPYIAEYRTPKGLSLSPYIQKASYVAKMAKIKKVD